MTVAKTGDVLQMEGEVHCALCGTHEIVHVEDRNMTTGYEHFPVLFHGVQIQSLYTQDDFSGEIPVEKFFYDFRFRCAFPEMPRVVEGNVVFY